MKLTRLEGRWLVLVRNFRLLGNDAVALNDLRL
jgi:hypothetical protein